MERMTIFANDINLHVQIDGDGPPVLLLHGFPDTSHLWRHVTPVLVAAGFKVIAFDQRGFGQSDAPESVDAYTIDKIAADAVAVLATLGVSEKVGLVGHDWGSFIGWFLCLTRPQLFHSFVAVSVGHPLAYRHAGPAQWLKGWYILMFQIPGLAETLFSANNYRALRKISKDPADAEQRVLSFSRKGRLTAALNWYRANFGKLLSFSFGKNSVPTLGIYSVDDVALTEKQMTDSQKYMSADWQYVRVEESSHWIPLDDPAQLAAEIIRWCRRPI
jgi:pimeloyl-ACP methyl ester carboxylesterase